jgi:hypothetical protein
MIKGQLMDLWYVPVQMTILERVAAGGWTNAEDQAESLKQGSEGATSP